MNDVSFAEQTMWIQLAIILTTYFIILWGIRLDKKLKERERDE